METGENEGKSLKQTQSFTEMTAIFSFGLQVRKPINFDCIKRKLLQLYFTIGKQYNVGPGSSVSIATELRVWTVRGSNPGVGEIFRTCPDRSWGPTSLLYNEYRVFPWGGGKKRPQRDAVPSSPSSSVALKSRVIPLL